MDLSKKYWSEEDITERDQIFDEIKCFLSKLADDRSNGMVTLAWGDALNDHLMHFIRGCIRDSSSPDIKEAYLIFFKKMLEQNLQEIESLS